MSKVKHISLIVVMFIFLLAGCNPVTGMNQNEDKSKELTVYTGLEEEQITAYMKSFQHRHPDIQLNIVRDSTGIITAKLLAEKENPKADVVWGVAASSLALLDQEGMFTGYSPKGVDRVSGRFKDNRDSPHWVGIDVYETAVVVNKKELAKRNLPIPRSYHDLLKPEYKGLIVMPNPSSSGTGFLTVSAFIQLFGEDKAWSYMDKLHKNIASYTHSGSKPAKLAAQGEYPIGISFTYPGTKEKEKGAPVEVVHPKEGLGWELEANALIKKNKIKPEAHKFLDWAISDDAMEEYRKNFTILSTDQEHESNQGVLKQLIENDFEKLAQDRGNILSEWDKRYSTKSESE